MACWVISSNTQIIHVPSPIMGKTFFPMASLNAALNSAILCYSRLATCLKPYNQKHKICPNMVTVIPAASKIIPKVLKAELPWLLHPKCHAVALMPPYFNR